jgi:hypothetical protein
LLQEFKDFVDLSDKAEEDENAPQSWLTTGSESVEMEDAAEHEVPPEREETTASADDRIAQETAAETAEEEEEDRVAVQLAEEAVWEDDKDWQIYERKKTKTVVMDDEVSFNIEVSDEDTNTAVSILFLFILLCYFLIVDYIPTNHRNPKQKKRRRMKWKG